jgi:DNA-binding NarL/FixJ family response regulator
METGLTPIFLKTGERDVLNHIMKGMTNKEIAHAINVSQSCVADRKRRLFDRFNVKDTKELIITYNNYLLKIKDIEEIRKKLVGGVR